MRRVTRLGIAVLLAAGSVAARRTAPLAAPPLVALPLAVLPPLSPLSSEERAARFRAALGDRYTPANEGAVEEASAVLDAFFDSPATRDLAVDRLAALGLAPPEVARLCAVRRRMLPETPGVFHVKVRVGPTDIDYVLGIPAGYVRTRATPVLVRLTNADDSPEEVAAYVEKKLLTQPLSLVIVPLYDANERWGPGLLGMQRVTNALRHAGDLVNIDVSRVALLGSGPAARGAWDVALHFPTWFVAVGVMAGKAGGEFERVRLPNLLNVHVTLWHDAKDDVIPIDESRQIVRILERLKQPVQLIETKGVGHLPDEVTIGKVDALIRTPRRVASPARVIVQSNRPELTFNRVDWLAVNQPRQTGEQRRSIIPKSRNVLVINPLVFRAEAAFVERNVLEIKTDNVDSLRVYLDDTLCDFSEPLVIRVGKKEVFNAVVAPRLDVTLRDQQLLGRGVRAYCAAVDLETVKGEWTATVVTQPATRPATKPSP